MGCIDDLDDALLETVLKFLNSTELRNTACLVCKRWRTACASRPGLWRDLEIDVAWEVYQPHGYGRPPRNRAIHRGAGGGRGGGGSSRSLHGSRSTSNSYRRATPSAFLSRDAISRWLQPHLPIVEILRISNTEMRITVVGYGPGASVRHDLGPEDLTTLLAALPALTELHLSRACDLLPDPSILLHQPATQPDDVATTAGGAAPAAAAATATSDALYPPLALPPAGGCITGPPLSERLRRLILSHSGYDFSTATGAAQAAALGALRGLRELTITLEPAAEEGLRSLPDTWSMLTGLTALRLGGHMRLQRLPPWFSATLRRLHELTLDACGFHRVPSAALAGLPQLRLLGLDRCPLGRGSAAVSLDAWWPPEEGAEAAAAAAREGGGPEAGPERSAAEGGGGGGGGGVTGLEVLLLRHCDILALPYTVTRLTNLRRLELGGNPLGDLGRPSSSSQMRGVVLRYLRESGDRGLGQLAVNTRLRHLGLERCGLSSVPRGVSDLSQLRSLDLSDNAELELYDRHMLELRERLPHLECLRLEGVPRARQLREVAREMEWKLLVLD